MVDEPAAAQCWCMALPRMTSGSAILYDANGDMKTCMCPTCLATLRAQRMATDRHSSD
jgi:hypothetical protein